jgi:trans-aconitate methyltransferase
MVRWDPKDYHCSSAAQASWAAELIAKLGLRGDERLLDIGSGDGKVTAEMARLLPQGAVVGVDNSEDMVAFAAEHYGGGAPNLSFILADARDLRFRDEFDVVFSNATLHWVRDHRPVLVGIRRSLRPGGRALLQMAGRGNAAALVEVLDGMLAAPRWAPCFADFSFPYGFHGAEEYRGWLLEAGLEPVRVELFDRDMAQEGAEGLAGWVRTTWMPYTQRVPEDDREAFIAEAVERYAAACPADGEGRLHVAMVRLEVEAARP